jgi:hypothetical protein
VMSKIHERREQLRAVCKCATTGGDVTRSEFKKAVLRYVHAQYDDPTNVLKRLYCDEGELGSLVRRAADRFINKELDDMEQSGETGARYPRTRFDDGSKLIAIVTMMTTRAMMTTLKRVSITPPQRSPTCSSRPARSRTGARRFIIYFARITARRSWGACARRSPPCRTRFTRS